MSTPPTSFQAISPETGEIGLNIQYPQVQPHAFVPGTDHTSTPRTAGAVPIANRQNFRILALRHACTILNIKELPYPEHLASPNTDQVLADSFLGIYSPKLWPGIGGLQEDRLVNELKTYFKYLLRVQARAPADPVLERLTDQASGTGARRGPPPKNPRRLVEITYSDDELDEDCKDGDSDKGAKSSGSGDSVDKGKGSSKGNGESDDAGGEDQEGLEDQMKRVSIAESDHSASDGVHTPVSSCSPSEGSSSEGSPSGGSSSEGEEDVPKCVIPVDEHGTVCGREFPSMGRLLDHQSDVHV